MLTDQVLVFDLDATLYNVGNRIEDLVDAKVIKFFMRELQVTEDQAKEIIRNIRQKYAYDVEASGKEFNFSKKEFMDYICDVDTSCIPQNKELSAKLARIPQRKFIMTDSTRAHVFDVLAALGVSADNFAGIFDCDDMQYTFKHNPESFKIFLNKYHLKAGECIMFEDSIGNLEIAKQVGFTTVLINSCSTVVPAFCDYQFATINLALDYFCDNPQK